MKKPERLYQIQCHFQALVVDPANAQGKAHHFAEGPLLTVTERLQIYQKSFELRLQDSLAEDFSLVRQQIGSEEFVALVKSFIRRVPSSHRNLAEYSADFVHFVAQHRQDCLRAVVREWLEIIDGQEFDSGAPLTLAELQQGRNFTVGRSHNHLVLKTNSTNLLAFRLHGEFQMVELSSRALKLLEFLTLARTLDELSEFSMEQRLVQSEVQELMAEWVNNKIIYFQRGVE
jgi:hypothetical protein